MNSEGCPVHLSSRGCLRPAPGATYTSHSSPCCGEAWGLAALGQGTGSPQGKKEAAEDAGLTSPHPCHPPVPHCHPACEPGLLSRALEPPAGHRRGFRPAPGGEDTGGWLTGICFFSPLKSVLHPEGLRPTFPECSVGSFQGKCLLDARGCSRHLSPERLGGLKIHGKPIVSFILVVKQVSLYY